MDSLLKKCISIIRLESTSTKWTPTPENYISMEFASHGFTNQQEIMDFLSYLHRISLNISIKQDIKGVNINSETLIKKFRSLNITPKLIPDYTIQDIPKRWEQLVQIRNKVLIHR
jgi:hypothetical protein